MHRIFMIVPTFRKSRGIPRYVADAIDWYASKVGPLGKNVKSHHDL